MFIKPIKGRILFQFVEDLNNDHFNQSQGGIFVIENKENQVKANRWGKVLAVGPDAQKDVVPDEYILIEALGWTNGMDIDEGVEKKGRFWFTDIEKVLCVSENKPDI